MSNHIKKLANDANNTAINTINSIVIENKDSKELLTIAKFCLKNLKNCQDSEIYNLLLDKLINVTEYINNLELSYFDSKKGAEIPLGNSSLMSIAEVSLLLQSELPKLEFIKESTEDDTLREEQILAIQNLEKLLQMDYATK